MIDKWGGQSAVLPGKAEYLRNVNCSCLGSVIMGGYVISFTQVNLSFPHICLWYLYIYIYGIPVHVAVTYLLNSWSLDIS